jgi:cell division septation protein DedD
MDPLRPSHEYDVSAEENMEETTSWKGHSFTLLVFGGIVVLCSIFFVLGMLVGRSQGQRIAELAAESDTKKNPAETQQKTGQVLTFQNTVTDAKPDLPLEAEPPPPESQPEEVAVPPPPPSAPAAVEAPPPPVTAIYLQVAALRALPDAQRILSELKGKGFTSVIILNPPASDPDPLYRVQVGPYKSAAEADLGKKELEGRGYKSVSVKK